jgi:predicted RNA-binding protein with RPS1 domain
MLTWVRREGKNTESKESRNVEEELTLNVGGFVSSKHEHVRWSDDKLTVGDEVCIRIINLESVDPASVRSTEDPAEIERRQERYVEQMAKRFGWTIQK